MKNPAEMYRAIAVAEKNTKNAAATKMLRQKGSYWGQRILRIKSYAKG
jgi:hypothetical protein